MPAEEKLKIIQGSPNRYHFKTKDDHRVDIEYTDDHLFVSLFKWGTETSLLIDLNAVSSTQHRFLETENRIEIENPDFLLRIYPIDTRSTGDFYGDSEDAVQCHDGGLRFELVLKKKRPAMNNFFTFPIISKNLRFSKQPFLTPEDIDAGVSCPLNVEGSYAVYHASKKNNQYMTGKAFHIYRPIAEDALGNKAWCSIQLDKAVDPTSLTLTIPQQFLDEAEYPITIDPDFGYDTPGSSWETVAQQAAWTKRAGSAWAMPAPGGTANFLKAYIQSNAADVVDCKGLINEKDSGGVGTHGQIAIKENLACAAAAHWEEFTLSGEALTQAVVYILNLVANLDDVTGKNAYQLAYDTDTTAISSYLDLNVNGYNPHENPWVAAVEGTTKDWSIYVNYDEPAVGWTGKISGVVNPAKIAGVDVANIAKVKGVA